MEMQLQLIDQGFFVWWASGPGWTATLSEQTSHSEHRWRARFSLAGAGDEELGCCSMGAGLAWLEERVNCAIA